jgi:hypothetical protein
MMQSSKGQPQAMVDQGPRFEKKPVRQNQVLSKAGVIRKDKRKKPKYY